MKKDKLIIELECEHCGQNNSFAADEIGEGDILTCNFCKHLHIWQACKFCGSGHYYSEYFTEGECVNCASIPEPKPADQIGLFRKLISHKCPYCNYPINPVIVLLPPEQIQCPSCKYISESSAQRGTMVSIFMLFVFLAVVGHETDFYSLLPEYINSIVFFTVVLGGALIFLSKCYDLKKINNR